MPSTLWRNRARREPCLVVIDEAHNVCPSRPADAVTALATNYAALIAAEGRKFGLYLLTSTQRPQKVHEEVLSQCDNLLLMRMNSEADLGYLSDTFSFVPPSLIQRATTFRSRRDLGGRQVLPTRDVRQVRCPDVAGRRCRHPDRLGTTWVDSCSGWWPAGAISVSQARSSTGKLHSPVLRADQAVVEQDRVRDHPDRVFPMVRPTDDVDGVPCAELTLVVMMRR